MARDLKLDIKGDAASARAALDAATAGVNRAKRAADELGDQFAQAAREAAKLDRQLLETKAVTATLAREFAKTGDAGIGKQLASQRKAANELRAVQADILGDTERNAKGAAAALAKALKDQKDLVERNRKGFFSGFTRDAGQEGGKAATTFAAALQGGIINAFTRLPPEAQVGIGAGVLAAVAAVGPLVAGTISAAVLLGVGGGGLAAGIALAAKDPKVSAAFGEFAKVAGETLAGSAKSFVDPLVRAAQIFKSAFASGGVIGTGLVKVFDALSRTVEPLSRGLVAFAEKAMPGLEAAAKSAEPVLKELANELPGLGAATGSFLKSISGGAPGAVSALKGLMLFLEGNIILFGKWVEWGSRVAGGIGRLIDPILKLVDVGAKSAATGQVITDVGTRLNDVGQKTRDAGAGFSRLGEETTGAATAAEQAGRGFSRLDGQVAATGTTTERAAGQFSRLALQAYNTADAADTMNSAFDRLFGEMMGVDEANLAVKEGMLQLQQTLKENGKTLDDNTEKGQANVQGILEQIQVLKQKREADIAAGDGTLAGTAKANAAYQANLAQLRALLVTLGYAPAAIDRIIAKYQQLANMPDINKNVHINTIYRSSGTPAAGFARLPGEASGGTVAQSGPHWVGEQGPEIRWLNRGDYISNAREAARMVTGGSSAAPAAKMTLNVTGDSRSWLYQTIMYGIQTGQLQVS